jgi:hypothetical protein
MIKLLIAFTCAMLIFPGILNCQAPDVPVVISISPEDRDFNRYFLYVNEFDSANVLYFFSDVRINTHGSYINVPLAHILDSLHGEPHRSPIKQGILSDLVQMCKTSVFIVPDKGSTIIFYRELGESSNRYPGQQPNTKGSWDISCTTEFVVNLVRADNMATVAVLDSTGSLPNDDPNRDARYGPGVKHTRFAWKVPDDLVGLPLYINVVPKIYGPSDFGISLKEGRTDYNLTSMYNDDGSPASGSVIDSLELVAWYQLTSYIDSVKSETGFMPAESYYIPQKYISEYEQRYLARHDRYISPKGDTVYIQVRTTFAPENDLSMVSTIENEGNLSTSPNPVNDDSPVNIKFTSKSNFDAYVEIESLDGKRIINAWQGRIWPGENEINLERLDLPNGAYMINLFDNSGKIRKSAKISIAK